MLLGLSGAVASAQPDLDPTGLYVSTSAIVVPEHSLRGGIEFVTADAYGGSLRVGRHVTSSVMGYVAVEGAAAPATGLVLGGGFSGGYSRGALEAGIQVGSGRRGAWRPFARAAMYGLVLRASRQPSDEFPEASRTASGAGVTTGAGLEVSLTPALQLAASVDVAGAQVQGIIPEVRARAARTTLVTSRIGLGVVWRP